jgi:hypothetical protein
MLLIAVASYLFDGLLNRRGRERLAGMEHPDPALFSQLRRATQGTQSDPIVQALHLQLIARGKLQLFSHGFRQYDPAELIDCQFASHGYHYIVEFGNNKWDTAMPRTLFDGRGGVNLASVLPPSGGGLGVTVLGRGVTRGAHLFGVAQEDLEVPRSRKRVLDVRVAVRGTTFGAWVDWSWAIRNPGRKA